jgi:phosphatidate cytidylyltransferase
VSGASAESPPVSVDPDLPPTRQMESSAERAANELNLRIASSIVLGALAIAVTWFGGALFQMFWAVAAAAILWEWVRMTSYRFFWMVLGVIYAAIFLTAMLVLRIEPYGFFAIIWLFALIWAADTAAYFTGRAVGGPKLWPAVSPNKTWSGAIAGAIVGIVAGMVVIWAAGLALRPIHVIIALIVVVAAQLGDLLESAIKRRFGVKDSSRLIPGHGGVMDRCDSLVTASAVALIIGVMRAANSPAQGLLLW